MIEYLVESTICSTVLYAGFLAFFRRSRSYHANRIILLFSVLFFLLAPLLKFSSNSLIAQEISENDAVNATISSISIISNLTMAATRDLYDNWSLSNLFPLYVLVATFLLGRLCFNLHSLLSGKFVVERTLYKGLKLALVNMNVGPFSFFQTVYVNKESFDNGEIDHELILHESGHVSQLHSIDIIFIELVQVFCWFNPFVFFFKKLIKTNHEYLADEFVVDSGANKTDYSNKIINYSTRDKTLNLASGFNYSLIKNRLIMLTKYDQKRPMFYRLTIFVSIVATLFVTTAFSNLRALNLGLTDNEKSGVFYTDTLFWSREDQQVYLKGKVKVKYGENDFSGQGSFSFLGKVNLLVVNGTAATLNSSFTLSGMKCEISVLSAEEAQKKYDTEGKFGAVEINTVK